ncbi:MULTISPECIES: hypothetical protein [unclassified Halomonas]|uniref:hypothetical protein n=1 Tax=unclassified Halomonas TaxID=2609666 RepID=UPI00209FBBB1|nr:MULTISPECIES: hypothetical protein [unclassified Halomonas]MCP1313832.1 hypothetical protein [Halomonas sp. 707D7]MCP1327588.1 hypothetical protein [Halomonas sp. 707D4]
MLTSRPFLLLVVAPLAFTAIVGAAIFGNQALSAGKVDQEIRAAIAAELGTASTVELSQLQEIQYGYGVCGLYRTDESANGLASFFYDTTNRRLVLDVNSRAYTANCGLSSVC